MIRFHSLATDIPRPVRFTFPFCYEPHPLCRLAAAEVQRYIAGEAVWRDEIGRGKMFGVLVVEREGRLGYLAAYSGQLQGRNDWPFFVPAVYDMLQPDGVFRQGERAIEAVGREIDGLENSDRYRTLTEQAQTIRLENEAEERAYKAAMAEAKARRDALRGGSALSEEAGEALVRESQHMKAELRRMRKRHAERLEAVEREAEAVRTALERLKNRRRTMSDDLQRWLFSQFQMLNSRGERRSLLDIFSASAGSIPPSGAGECCAPKLLQYAFSHGLKPVCMAEFWWGESPKAEVRHHLSYYPACRGKCKPILEYMLQGMETDPDPLADGRDSDTIEVVYEDEAMAVVCKPAGMLSVPGKSGRKSVLSELRKRWPSADGSLLVHRLDMDTSGLLVAAKTMATYVNLQRQFASRTIRKTYVALLSRRPDRPKSGVINLPMRPDPLDRPRQVVDEVYGKEAQTEYRIVGESRGLTRVLLVPHTGRTHQLRLHCAHERGLGAPIEGDRLYGRSEQEQFSHEQRPFAYGQSQFPNDQEPLPNEQGRFSHEQEPLSHNQRLFLHAQSIELRHPVTGKPLRFERDAGF